MTDIIIACAGGYGIEAYGIINAVNRDRRARGLEDQYRLLGFLSDVDADLSSKQVNSKIIGKLSDWQPIGDERYIIGLSKPEAKHKVAEMLKRRGAKFETIIHPQVVLGENVTLGEGCMVSGGSIIGSGIEIGAHVCVMASLLMSGAKLGDYTTSTGFTVVGNAYIGEGVFLGSKAVISENTVVGDWANVSVGAVVEEDVPSGATVFGSPATIIG